ncbi:MAG: hypothetical protein J5831_03260, partial [Bacteroidales bacterium]|nr:hypothetical protein [Bacteroidales bacterium]
MRDDSDVLHPMRKQPLPILLTILLLLTAPVVKAQLTFSNDFENGTAPSSLWNKVQLVADTLGTEVDHRCECEPDQEYGLEFRYPIPSSLFGKNLHLTFQADCSFPDAWADTVMDGETPRSSGLPGRIVFTVMKEQQNLFWYCYDLSPFANDSTPWFQVAIGQDLPADLLQGSFVQVYLWNPGRQRIRIDNASVTLTPWSLSSFLPEIPLASLTEGGFVLRQDDSLHTPLSHPIGLLTEYVLQGDTMTDYRPFTQLENGKWETENALLSTVLTTNTDPGPTRTIQLATTFHKEGLLLRQALVVPFIDSTLAIYRKNLTIDTAWFQPEYYLDREGFKVGTGERSVVSYHQTGISSTQFNAVNRVACFNLDYWRDHPMIHYPLSDTLDDVFEDRSSRPVHDGMQWQHDLVLSVGNDLQNLPRILPIPFGYESGIIFTEHADWTDLRTHRAVLFGSEKAAKAKDATGGFVYYGIPVTKSVFYNNPDQVTNETVSQGTFKGSHATIKTDREFEKLLKRLYRRGFDICLHTPEQYTTTPGNLQEALDYMQRHFKSATWIDHGYNNGTRSNREDLVCDGLDRQSDYFAAEQWQRHGIKYLWNAYYEENHQEPWEFDSQLTKPYPGFGDALPNRQIASLTENGALDTEDAPLYTWCTPATLEAVTDEEWDYYFSGARLQRLVDNHTIHITHVYPAWVWPGRTCWTYDADSTIVLLPGMNRALARIAALRDEHKMLPMTVKTYLDHYCGLLQVTYEIIDSEHIRLHNLGDEIKGFTLLCRAPIRIGDHRHYEIRKSGNEYYVWFTLKSNDTITLEITTPTPPRTP